MSKLNMKKGSYNEYPYKKNQKIDSIIILEDNYDFINICNLVSNFKR